jgi:DNA polymerase-3 subunit alpha
MVATINNFGGFYRTELYVHEARMHGGIIVSPCVNHSFNETSIRDKTIYLGLMFLRLLESKIAKRLVQERLKNGIYKSLDDFIDRVPISIEQISILIKINAFRFTGRNKRELLWEAHMKINKVSFEEHIITLFKSERITYQTPQLLCSTLENAFDEIELLGFSLCNPFELLIKPQQSLLKANELINYINKTIIIEGYLVTTKNTRTSKGRPMYFGTFLDRDGDFIDTVHFPPIAAKYPFRGKGIYLIRGKVLEEFDCVNIEVISMVRLAIVEDPRYADSKKKIAV